MKILLLCWRDTAHPQGGGSERYLERVGEYLAAHGHDVVYRTAAAPGLPRRSERGGVRYSRSGGKYGVYVRAFLAMLAGRLGLGTLRGVDCVVDTQNGIPFFARLASGKPTVVLTHHCHREQWPVAGPLIGRLGWWLESRVSPAVHRRACWVTVSEPSAAELAELGVPREQIHIIRNGVDPIPGRVPHLPDDGRTHLVTLSRLVPHKQIEHAMDVVRELDDSVVLDVVGSGWWSDELCSYARKIGVLGRVRFHGQVSEEHKHALLSRAALHLMPSRKEGWGLAVVEAAQHAVPTVGYRASRGLTDSVEDGVTGVLVDVPNQLIAAVRELLADDARRRELGAAAKARANGYSWEETGAAFEALLRGLAS